MLVNISLLIIIIAVLLAVLQFFMRGWRFVWFGKISGFIIGFVLASSTGALIGLLLGHVFDMMIQPRRSPAPATISMPKPTQNKNNEETVEHAMYFDTLFSVLGHFVHAATEPHTVYLSHLRAIMQQMQLDEDQQHNAWDLFKHGEHVNFNLTQALFIFVRHSEFAPNLQQQLLRQLIDLATLKLPLTMGQYTILCAVAHAFKLSTTEFAHLAPKAENVTGKEQTSTALEKSYEMLGIKPSASSTEIKGAYRKLMSRYHPDRLMAKDLPEELIELATSRTQEIKSAYEKICVAKGIK